METGRIVYTIAKNPEEEVRFTVGQYKDRHYLDLRLWFQPAKGGQYRPTKKGLTLSLEHIPELKKGLERASEAAKEFALHESPRQLQ